MSPFHRLSVKIVHNKGIHFRADTGWLLSCQQGPGNYADNYDASFDAKEFPQSHTVEIAIWYWGGVKGGMIQFPDGDTVLGHVTWDDVLTKWLPLIANTKAGREAGSTDDLEAAQ